MSTARLLFPALVLGAGLACDSLQPTQLDQFGNDSVVSPDGDTDPVEETEVDTDDVGVGTPGGNQPPRADAGPPRINAEIGETVFLDGSGSSDPEGGALRHQWTLKFRPGGSTAIIDNPSFATAQITVDRAGSYEIHLMVTDPEGASNTDVTTINVASENTPPIAEAGMNQTTLVGSLVQLSGAGSYDPEGDEITYAWSFASRPGSSQATLVGTSVQPATSPRFTADAVGQFVIQLIVNDGVHQSQPDLVYVTVNSADPGSSGGSGGDDCLSCAEADQVGRRFSSGDAAHGLGMALLPLMVLLWGRRRGDD